MTREVLNRSIDARQVPSILARPSGGIAEAVVVRSEIDQLISDVLDKVGQLRESTEQSEATDTANWQQAIGQLTTRLNDSLDGVKEKYAVANSVATLADLQPNLSGLDTTAADWHSWVLVRGALSENGVYRYQGGNWVRVPKFAVVDTLQAGVMFYDDANNVHYVVSADAQPVSAVNPAVGSIELIPYSRAEEISGSGFISVVANQINAALDEDWFQVENGRLSTSLAFYQRLQEYSANDAEFRQSIEGINTILDGLNSRVAQFEIAINNATQTLVTHTSQIEALQQADAAFAPRLQATETAIADLSPRLTELEQTDAQQQQQIEQQIQGLTNAQRQLTQQDTTLAGHTQQLATAQQGINNLDAAVTDARASILAHTNELGQLTTQISNKLDSSQLDELQEKKLEGLVKRFPLIGGIRELRVDTDDNTQYHFTTFEISTGWGHLNFRSFDLSEITSPYNKQGFSFVFQRTKVDSFKIIAQSRLDFFPDGLIEASLIRIPGQSPQVFALISPGEISISGDTPYSFNVFGLPPGHDFTFFWVGSNGAIPNTSSTAKMPADGKPYRTDATGIVFNQLAFIQAGEYYQLSIQTELNGSTQFFGSNIFQIKA